MTKSLFAKETTSNSVAPKKVSTGGSKNIFANMSKNPSTENGMTNEQIKYTKNLGYTPSELPSFFTERKDKNFLEATVGNIFDRLGSGFNKAFSNLYSDSARNVGGKDPGAALKYAVPGFTPLSFIKNYLEGALGNTDYSHNVSAIREIMDAPTYQRDVIAPQKNTKLPFEIGGLKTVADMTQNPTLQYAGQNVASIFDPIAGLVGEGAVKGIGKLAKAGAKLPVAEKIINSVREGINSSELAQKVGSKVIYGFGTKPNELKAVENIATNRKFADIFAGYQDLIARGEKLKPKDLAVLQVAAEKVIPDKVDEFMKGVMKLQENSSNLVQKTGFLKKEIPKSIQGQAFDQIVSGKIDSKIKDLVAPYQIAEQSLKKQLIDNKLLQEGQAVDNYLHFGYKNSPDLAKIPTVQAATGGLKIGAEKGVLMDRIPDLEWAKGYLSRQGQNVNQLARATPEEITKLAMLGRKDAGLISQFNQAAAISTQKAGTLLVKYKGLEDLNSVLAQNGRIFDSINNIGKDVAKYAQLPNSESFGSLAGKFVPRTIAESLQGVISPKAGTLQRLTSLWKQAMLFMPLNTKSVMRNQVTALLQHEITGFPIVDQLKGLPTAYKDIKNGTSAFKEALRAGLFEGTSDNVIGKVTKEAFGNTDILDKVNNIVSKVSKGNALWGKEGFMGVEQANRLNGFKYWLSKGKTADEAVNLVNKAMYDYSRAPLIINELGKTAVPFIQFKYFAAKQLLETLATKPEKLYQLYKGKNFIEGLSQAQANDRDLPDWMKQSRATVVRTPFLDEKGNPTYFDASNIVPFGDTISGRNQLENIVLGNPFARIIYDVSNNTNSYFDTPIYDKKKDLPQEQTTKVINYILGQLGPKTVLNPTSYDSQKIIAAVKNYQDQAGRTNSLPNVLSSTFAGLRLYPVDPQKQAGYNKKDIQAQISSLNTKIKDISSDKNLSAREKEDKIKEIRLYQQELKVNSGYYQ